ncbi:bifunctional ADP-dependent NAD(P)H-hydrate dehydratase/NAD(P)H-hydrate epimerase, partial [Pseudomonas quasicaspiana]|nr:bifunctional ADP-dependent NAD(P)H-hydrate dehydratase/NAD(P)H-hydrate epimerase [Pseudomonas quasicaspiana]
MPAGLLRQRRNQIPVASVVAAPSQYAQFPRFGPASTRRALRRRWPEARELSVLAGRGNNAGDGYLIATLAQKA